MKKVIISIVVCVIALGLCVFAYLYFTDQLSGNKEPIAYFTLENYPKVDGSTATHPLMDAFLAGFTLTPIEQINTTVLKTHKAYLSLIDGTADLFIGTSPSEEEFAYAKEKNVELEIIPVVNEAFVFLVNVDNPVDTLTIKQIQDIYSGKITNWKEVGGPDLEIIAYQRPVNSGSQTGMLNLVMKDIEMATPKTEQIPAEMSQLIDVVANYDNSKAAIGYSYYYYANQMYTKDTVKFIKVEGVEPNFQTIGTGKYPIQTKYYIVINKAEPKDGDVRKLVNLMLSKDGQKMAKEAGYVPIEL